VTHSMTTLSSVPYNEYFLILYPSVHQCQPAILPGHIPRTTVLTERYAGLDPTPRPRLAGESCRPPIAFLGGVDVTAGSIPSINSMQSYPVPVSARLVWTLLVVE